MYFATRISLGSEVVEVVSQELWQIEVQDRVYEATLDEVIEWIKEGAVLPEDRIRRGNLRWLSAGRVPELRKHFQSDTADEPASVTYELVTDFSDLLNVKPDAPADVAADTAQADESGQRFCLVHPSRPAAYYCKICGNLYCTTCPNKFGSDVRLCPSCGAMCAQYVQGEEILATRGAINKPYARRTNEAVQSETETPTTDTDTGLRFRDLLHAVKVPFRFPADFILCSFVVALLLLGQSSFVLGEIPALIFAVGCALLLSALLFGTLSKISENFAEDEPDASFRSRFRASTFHKDFVQPFLLGVAVFIVAFGAFFVLTAGAGVYAWWQFSDSVEAVESAMRESQTKLDLAAQEQQLSGQRVNIEESIEQSRQKLINSVLGREYAVDNPNVSRIIKSFMRLSLGFLMPIALAFVFGVVFFAAACATAVSTGSFKKTINPLVAFKTMRKFGFDYIKLLLILQLSVIVSAAAAIGVYQGFSRLEMPLAGFIAAIVTAALLFFFFWLVFSRLLVTATHRNLADTPAPLLPEEA